MNELLIAMFLSMAPLAVSMPVRLSGIATVYHLGDGQSGKTLGCPSEARRLFGSAHFHDELPVVATRRRPRCGSIVTVENVRTGLRTLAIRADSGPWGCRWPNGARTVERACAGGRRVAIADLTLRVAREIGHNGKEPVRLRWR